MSLDLIQWGNAYYNTTVCGRSNYVRDQVFCWDAECNVVNPESQCFNMTTSKIMCQHGDVECLANLYQSCAATVADSEILSFGFHNCSSSAYSYSWRYNQVLMEEAMSSCAKQVNDTFASSVFGCYEKGQLDGVTWSNYAKRTIQLGSGRPGTPYTLVNGKALTTTVIDAVCKAYEGVKPTVCSSLHSRRGYGIS